MEEELSSSVVELYVGSLLKLKPCLYPESQNQVDKILDECNVDANKIYGCDAEIVRTVTRGITVRIPTGKIKRLLDSDWIRSIQFNQPYEYFLNSSVEMIQKTQLRNRNLTGKNIRVGVIDSGLDENHPDFNGKRIIKKNFSSTGTANDVTDDDGHGTHVAGIVAGQDNRYQGIAPDADLVIAKVGSRVGIDVLAEAVRWMISDLSNDEKPNVINLSMGGPRVIDYRGKWIAVPPPWVFPTFYDDIEDEIRNAYNSGIPVCVAAGNEGTDYHTPYGTIATPARIQEAITVGSCQKNRELSPFSSRGPVRIAIENISEMYDKIVLYDIYNEHIRIIPLIEKYQEMGKIELKQKPDILAPGGGFSLELPCKNDLGIISSRSSITHHVPCHVGNDHIKMSGTSMACPHIAGLVALLLEGLNKVGSSLPVNGNSVERIRRSLLQTATKLGYPDYWEGRGLVQGSQALDDLLP